jgi:hypothetical protein
MVIKWLRKRKANKVAEELQQAIATRQVLLDGLRKSVDTHTLHTELQPGIRRRAARPTTISYDHYQTMKRLGASEGYLERLKPVVRDWPTDENPGEFIFRS